jgi:hypothetical protein
MVRWDAAKVASSQWICLYLLVCVMVVQAKFDSQPFLEETP